MITKLVTIQGRRRHLFIDLSPCSLLLDHWQSAPGNRAVLPVITERLRLYTGPGILGLLSPDVTADVTTRPRPVKVLHMQLRGEPLDALLQTQAGVVARWQALTYGLSESAISRHLRSQRWQAVSPGIYATFSGLLTRPAELWAALLSASQGRFAGCREPPTGPDAVLSHETATELHDLADQPDRLIHVTIPNGRRSPRPVAGIRVHISTRLHEARHPDLSPPRTRLEETAIDLTQTARSLDDAINWLSMACGRRLTTAARLADLIHSRKKLRWRCELLAALGDAATGDHSLLELRYHRKVEWAHRLPKGIRQKRRELDRRVEYDDVTYPEWGVIVHLDGHTHRYAARFRDMRRDNAAVIRGAAPLRYGWADVDERPCEVAAQVVLVLARNGWPGQPRRCGPGCSLDSLLAALSTRSWLLPRLAPGCSLDSLLAASFLITGSCMRQTATDCQ